MERGWGIISLRSNNFFFEVGTAHRWRWTSQCVELRQLRCYRISLWLTQGNILASSTLLVLFPFSFLLVPASNPVQPPTSRPVRFLSILASPPPIAMEFRLSLSPWFPFRLPLPSAESALNLPNGPLYYALMSDASVSRFDLVSEISMSSFRVFHDSSTSKVIGRMRGGWGVLRCDLLFRESV